MSYCTVDDLIAQKRDGEAELIQLTDTDNSGAINYLVIDQAIVRANAEINKYLLAYLPLTSISADLVYLACDITRYYLYGDRVSARIEALYKQAIDYLKLVAAGKIPFAPSTSLTVDASTYTSVEFTSIPPVFGSNNGY
jgi:phage gp36-like protein